jgi:transcriptional regulator with XRE-family HTH domain
MIKKTLGQIIRELREGQNLGLREFAKKIEKSAAFVSDIELGRRFPSDSVLIDIARGLKVNKEVLENHDARPPLEEIKRIAESNPTYGFALRTMVDELKPEDLINFIQKKTGKKDGDENNKR